MINLFKKLICIVSALFIFSFSAVAATDITLNAGKDFLVYSQNGDNGKIAAALNIGDDELSSYISENGIKYFAINKDNTVQVKLSVSITEFSSGVSDLSNLSDDNIESLLPEITGIDNVRGDTVDKTGQKFAEIRLSSRDSGGDYTVTQFITVAQKKLYVLSVSVSADDDADYADKVFATLDSSDFNHVKTQKSYYGYVILGAVFLIAAVCVYVAVTLIRDIISGKNRS